MYTRITTKTRRGRLVEEYYTAMYGAPGRQRRKKKNPTPEQVAKNNQWQKEKRTWIRLLEHFSENDYFCTMTFRKEERPADMKEARQIFKEAREKIWKAYAKRGHKIKWIRNIEVGTKGAWHIHMVINRIPDTDMILAKAWTHGKVVHQLLYERGGFRDLAAYITKTPKTDPRQRETDFDTARNLPLPQPKKRTYKRWKLKDDLKAPKGWYIEQESFREGENPYTGLPYRTYLLKQLGGGGKRGG